MDLREEGKKILRTHQILFEQLIQIPLQREILYREDIENGNHIGKPRFIPEEYEWSSDLLKYLHNHLQSIYLFFEKYYYWYDDTLIPLIDKRFRRTSNSRNQFEIIYHEFLRVFINAMKKDEIDENILPDAMFKELWRNMPEPRENFIKFLLKIKEDPNYFAEFNKESAIRVTNQ